MQFFIGIILAAAPVLITWFVWIRFRKAEQIKIDKLMGLQNPRRGYRAEECASCAYGRYSCSKACNNGGL